MREQVAATPAVLRRGVDRGLPQDAPPVACEGNGGERRMLGIATKGGPSRTHYRRRLGRG